MIATPLPPSTAREIAEFLRVNHTYEQIFKGLCRDITEKQNRSVTVELAQVLRREATVRHDHIQRWIIALDHHAREGQGVVV